MGRPAALILAALVALAAGCVQTRDPETIACSPGERVLVGCGACGVGACAGDPVLRVCDGDLADPRACADSIGLLGESDDACGSLCPALTITCPPGGRIAVVHRSFRGGAYECGWDVRPGSADAGP